MPPAPLKPDVAARKLGKIAATGALVLLLAAAACAGTSAPEVSPTDTGDCSHDRMPIFGRAVVTARRMDSYVRTINPDAPALGQLYLDIAQKYGIRGDIAFAQVVRETEFFSFGGDVRPSQSNFAGIGATGGGVRGATFDNAREGITAHIQHLYAYATTDPLPPEAKLFDPRFDLVDRASARYVEALAGRWSVPGYETHEYPSLDAASRAGDTYGDLVVYILRDMMGEPLSGRCAAAVQQTLTAMLKETRSALDQEGALKP